MGWQLPSRVGFLTLVFSLLCFMATIGSASGASVKLLESPLAYSQNTTAAFSFSFEAAAKGGACGCTTVLICRLDDSVFSDCDSGKVMYLDLDDRQHIFEVCVNGSYQDCASYSWTIDTVPPTAEVTSPTSLTSDKNVSVDISFSEPCSFGGSFGCSSADSCNLLVQGAGEVIPSSLKVVEPNRKYKLLVSLASSMLYGQVTLLMDKDFCADAAGNGFTPTANSTFLVNFDRRNVSLSLSSHIPEKLYNLFGHVVKVQATNDHDDLKFQLNFSQPVVNNSTEIMNALHTSEGNLASVDGCGLGNQMFSFMVTNVSSSHALINLSFESHSIRTRQGTAVSPIAPFTFLYDVERTTVRLSTSTFRTREDNISISIHFFKPVVGFDSSNITISGGQLLSFDPVSWTAYTIKVQALSYRITVSIPENATGDLAGNQNRPSNLLVVRHDSTHAVAVAVSSFTTTSFVVMSAAAGLLAVSTANLQVRGDLPSSGLTLQPSSNLFRMLCHIQAFALSRRLMETPNVYNELALSLQWSIPHYSLPWEGKHIPQSSEISKKLAKPISFFRHKVTAPGKLPSVDPAPLPFSFVDNVLTLTDPGGNPKIAAAYRDGDKDGWAEFSKSMFPLAYTTCSFLLLHCLLFILLKLKRKKSTEKPSNYGSLTFPRIEIFLMLEAVAGVCQGSAALLHGGTPLGAAVGSILLVIVLVALLALLLFLLVGSTHGKLLRYKEEVVHQESRQQSNCYQQLCGLILGPGAKGRWTWKGQADSVYLTMFGLLFEDLRGGPPRLAPSQISGNNEGASRRGGDGIIITFKSATLKLLQSLSVYYTLIESIKRAWVGVLAGNYLRNWHCRSPAITMLCINSFQLFFLVVGKPFIKRRVQLVNIISVASEVGLYASGVALQKNDHQDDSKAGYLMVCLFLAGVLALMANEVYGLYSEVKKLDDPDGRSFSKGLKVAMDGIRSFFTFSSSSPQPEAVGIETQDPEKGAGPSSEGNSKSSLSKKTDPLAVAPLATIPNPEDAKIASKDAEEIGSSSPPFTDNIEAQIEDPLAAVAPPEAIPHLEAASTQTGEDAKSVSKDDEEIGSSSPPFTDNIEAQIEDPLAAVAPPEAIPHLEAASTQTGEDAKSVSKDAEEIGSSSPPFTDNIEAQIEDPLAAVAPPEAIPHLEAALTQTGEDAKSASKDAEEIGSAPSSGNVEAQTEEDVKTKARDSEAGTAPSSEAAETQTGNAEAIKL